MGAWNCSSSDGCICHEAGNWMPACAKAVCEVGSNGVPFCKLGTDRGTLAGSGIGPNGSPWFELVGDDKGEVNCDPRGLSLLIVLFRDGICSCSCEKSNGGRLPSCGNGWCPSSLSRAITEPDPFFGPLFFRAISLVHLRPDDTHLRHGSVFSHFTLRRLQASQGRSRSGVAGSPAWSSLDCAIERYHD